MVERSVSRPRPGRILVLSSLLILSSLLLSSASAGAAAKPATSPEIAPATPQQCALLDNPRVAGRLDGLLLYLAKACGREAEFLGGVRQEGAFPGENFVPEATDVPVNNPLQDTSGTAKTQSETSIALNETTGTLCAAWNDSFSGVTQGAGYSGFGRSTNGGTSFTDQGNFPTVNGGDPSLVWRKSDGKFYYAALTLSGGLVLYRSDDDCQSFVQVGPISSTGNDDKEIMAVDNFPASTYYGRLYVAWTDFTDGRIKVRKSSNGGTSWDAAVPLSASGADVQGAWPAVAPNGTVYVGWVRWNPTYPAGPIDIEVVKSTDGGATFSSVANPATGKTVPQNASATSSCGRPALKGNIRYLPSPTVAVDSVGNLHVVYSYDPDGGGTDNVSVYYRRSTTGGASWDPEILINDDGTTTDQWQPSLSIGVGNVVTVGYYSRQNDVANNTLFDYYSRTSYNGGATFNASARMSDVSSAVVLDANLATCYHGDYDTQTHGGGFAHYLWSDDRDPGSGANPNVWTDVTPAGTDFLPLSQQASRTVCSPTSATYTIDVLQFLGFSEQVTLSASGNPAGSTTGFAPNPVAPGNASVLTVTTAGVSAGTSTITVTGTSSPSGIVHSTPVDLTVFTAAPGVPALTAPANGALNVPIVPTFTWTGSNVVDYLLEVATDAGFSNIVYSATVTGTSHVATTSLASNSSFFWRVTGQNACGDTPSGTFTFSTVALPGDCATGTTAHVIYSSYSFEPGTGGFTHSGTGDTWARVATNPHSGTQNFFASDPASVTDQRLASPSIGLPTGENPVVVKFWHVANLEPNTPNCYDGGILEVSNNGGSTWTQVPAGSILTGGYQGAVSTCCSNPLAGLQAWCGTGTYTYSVADLSSYAGQSVQFRFRLGSDSSVSNPGWSVDDVVVQSCTVGTFTNLFSDGFESGDTTAWSQTSP